MAREARDAGYRIGALQSSEMGVRVYECLGFRQVCVFRHRAGADCDARSAGH